MQTLLELYRHLTTVPFHMDTKFELTHSMFKVSSVPHETVVSRDLRGPSGSSYCTCHHFFKKEIIDES